MATRTMTSRLRSPLPTMSFTEYAAAGGCNFSTLKYMAQSPLHYWHALNNPPVETPAMLLGKATHTAVFEPLKFQLEYALWAGDRRGVDYREFADGCAAQGRTILKENEYGTALAIRDAVRGLPVIAGLLGKGHPEISILWHNAETGVACKARLDWLTPDGIILDLKTTSCIEPRRFAAHAWEYGYFHQQAYYQDALRSTGGTPRQSGIIAVEAAPPHACRLYWLDDESLRRARMECISWLERVRECAEAGVWPGPEPESTLTAPPWAIPADGPAVDFAGVTED